jgi:RHS repeat-associated protein
MHVPNRFASLDDYRYGFNGMEKDDEIKGEGNSYDFGARMLDTRVGRWFAVDPIHHPNSSPYAYVNNNPIIYVDPDGKDNIIYLVILPSAYNSLTVKDINEIIKETNKVLESFGLETRVKVFNPEKGGEFNSNNLDKTDSFILIGDTKDIVKEFGKKPNNYNDISKNVTSEEINNNENYELATLNGEGLLIKSDQLKSLSENLKTDIIKTTSYIILHATGHNAGMGADLDRTVSSDHNANIDENYKFVEVNENVLVKRLGVIARSVNPEVLAVSPLSGTLEKPDRNIAKIEDTFKPKNNPTYAKRIVIIISKNVR